MQTIWLGEAGAEAVEEEQISEQPSHEERPSDTVESAYPLEEVPSELLDPQLINWRGRLTEFCQKQDLLLPDVNEINPVGARGTFSFVCKFSWGKSGSPPLLVLRTCGTAKKKKYAKREAARLMCKRMSDLTNFPEPMHNDHNPEDRGYWGPSFPACPRSADESGEVCPPLGYEEFDHSEPLPDVYGYGGGYDDGYAGGYDGLAPGGGSLYLAKSKAPWEQDEADRDADGYGPEGHSPMSGHQRFGDYEGRGRGRGKPGTGGWGDSAGRSRGGGSIFL